MKNRIIASFISLITLLCFGRQIENIPQITPPEFFKKPEKEKQPETPRLTREDWLHQQFMHLLTCNPTNSFEELEFVTGSRRSKYERLVHFATERNGYHYFNETNWVILVTANYHNDNIDAVLLMDQDRKFYTIEMHPCGGLQVYSKEEFKIDSLDNLLKTVSRKRNKWKPYK